MDRRTALKLLGFGVAVPAAGPLAASPSDTEAVFRHGVASGDPGQDRLIIWTRATPTPGQALGRVAWPVAEDPELTRVVAEGVFETGPERDFTVKGDVGGLSPARTYFYGFRMGQHRSPVGQARTLPDGPLKDLVLAVVSC